METFTDSTVSEVPLALGLTAAPTSAVCGRVLVLVAAPGEAARVCDALANICLHPEPCANVTELCQQIEEGAEAVVLACETLRPDALALLQRALVEQPPWSDLPLVVLADPTEEPFAAIDVGPGALNPILLEQPVSTRTLQSVVQAALRARYRQYQLREYLAELTRTEHRERRRLAQLLHDHLQQLLVAARIKVDSLSRHTAPPDLAAPLRQIDELLVQVLDASRLLTVELCPPVLREAGLSAALEWLARQVEETHGLRVAVAADSAVDPQAEDLRVLLFEAVRELLFNTVKHAGVGEAQVSLSRASGNRIQVVVCDQGRGFDANRLTRLPGARGGFGLFSLRERLAMLGGRLDIETSPGTGTRAVIVAPRR